MMKGSFHNEQEAAACRRDGFIIPVFFCDCGAPQFYAE
ncbi:hypothetical protein CHCC19467_2451 [Bacillus paralicheniformis]|nr:hypothetical protein CHCC19467_2451 [Bacillus paralicheniformis]